MKETTKHRRALDIYVRLGSRRSLEELRLTLEDDPSQIGLSHGPSQRAIDDWSVNFHWQDRVQELERQASERDREDQINALREMDERHAKEALALQQKGLERLQALEPSEMTPTDAIRSVAEGVKIERLARGAASRSLGANEEEGVDNDGLENFSEEDLRRLAKLGERGSEGTGKAKSE